VAAQPPAHPPGAPPPWPASVVCWRWRARARQLRLGCEAAKAVTRALRAHQPPGPDTRHAHSTEARRARRAQPRKAQQHLTFGSFMYFMSAPMPPDWIS
jgi:hypothetical protein